MEKRRSEKRELILSAAQELFFQNGYSDTRIIDIAEKAGIGKGTVYEYFTGKGELFYQLFYERIAKPSETIKEIKTLEGPSSDKIRAYVVHTFRMMDDIPFAKLTPDMLDKMDCMKDERLQKLFRDTVNGHIELIQDVIEKGIQTGEFRKIDTYLAAIFFLAICHMGYKVEIDLLNNFENASKMDKEKLIDEIMDFSLAALRT